jgi:hypothetical protein
MFPNPQSALPLPPHPSLERYKKLAKELIKACKSGDEGAVGNWAERWIRTLTELAGRKSTRVSSAEGDLLANTIEDFARRRMRGSEAAGKKCALADAQFVIVRSHGFESWPKFAKHLEELARKSSLPSRFEAAADAIVSGDAATLKRLLGEDQKLVRAISTREHSATLLHYASANGVEGYRQKTPANIVEITEMLLNAVPKLMPQLRCTAADARLWGWRRLASIPSALAYRKHCSRRFWIMVPVLSSLPLQATSNPL